MTSSLVENVRRAFQTRQARPPHLDRLHLTHFTVETSLIDDFQF